MPKERGSREKKRKIVKMGIKGGSSSDYPYKLGIQEITFSAEYIDLIFKLACVRGKSVLKTILYVLKTIMCALFEPH